MGRRGTGAVRSSLAVLLVTASLALGACTADPAPSGSPPATTVTPVTTAQPPATAEPTPSATPWSLPAGTTMSAVFGSPWSKKAARQHAVAISAMEIIDGAPKGATVLASVFNISYPGMDEVLIRADRRGVHVRVLVNHEATRRPLFKRLQRTLGSDPKRRSSVVVRGGGVRMHSKFVLATRSGDRENVVWMSSGNLTRASGRYQANEALTITGDPELHDFFAEQFALMADGVTDPGVLARSVTTPTAQVWTFPQPEGGRANDPVAALLDDISCVTDQGTTIVRLGQLFLTDERIWIAERLRELKAAGCDVRVIGHLSVWGSARGLLVAPGDGQIDLRDSVGAALHTKLTSIDGFDAAGRPLKVLMAGSHNLTGRALTVTPEGVNDEFAILIRDPATVDAYSAWIDQVIAKHSEPYRDGDAP